MNVRGQRILRSTTLVASAIVGSLVALTPSWADVVIMRDGTTYGVSTSGQIRSATYELVKFRLDGTRADQNLEGDDVLRIEWKREGSSTRQGRGDLAAGRYEEAVKRFRNDHGNPEEMYAGNAKYLTAVAYLRWANEDSSKAQDAVKAFQEYLSEFESKKHFYVPEAVASLAEAQIALGKFAEAESSYQKLASGSLGAGRVLNGRLGLAEVQLAQKKYDEARSAFSTLINDRAVQEDAEYNARALVGYAKSQLGKGLPSGAIETVTKRLLVGADERPERLDRYAAQGFLIWGQAEEAEGGTDEKAIQFAIIRYYRAVSIAETSSEEYAEGLYRAMKAWEKLNRRDEAQRVKQRLLKECPRSPWATRAK